MADEFRKSAEDGKGALLNHESVLVVAESMIGGQTDHGGLLEGGMGSERE